MKRETKTKSKIIKLAIAIAVIISVSVALFFILRAVGVTDIDNLRYAIKSCGIWGWAVFLILQITFTVLFCFVPATSMTFVTLGVILFGARASTFVLCFSGIVISSVCMDLIGRFGGSKLIIKLIGQEDYENALKLVQTKGIVYVPVMYLLPVFPDDAICMCCGACKLKWWVHYIEIVLCRGIGCATVVFGVNLLPTELTDNLKTFNWSYIGSHIWDYLTMVTVIVFWVFVLFYTANKIVKKLEARNSENKD